MMNSSQSEEALLGAVNEDECNKMMRYIVYSVVIIGFILISILIFAIII